MFANIYLNEVDQYIKHELKVKYYFRYLDDSVLLIQTKEKAKILLYKIQKFLKQNLKLELNNKTQIFKNKQGVNFCGYKINEYRLKIQDICGHIGYIKYANVRNLTNKLFYEE